MPQMPFDPAGFTILGELGRYVASLFARSRGVRDEPAGSGHSCRVYLAQYTDGRQYALKTIAKADFLSRTYE